MDTFQRHPQSARRCVFIHLIGIDFAHAIRTQNGEIYLK